MTDPIVVCVEWLDAWLDVGEASESDEHPRTSVGYLIANGSKIVRICQSWDSSGGDDYLTVPTGMVTKITKLENGDDVPIGKSQGLST